MPGHIIHAECVCGFECELHPGATYDTGRVIAYTADGTDLGTVDQDTAARERLVVLPDPYLLDLDGDDLERFFSVKDETHGPFRCPRCGNDSLLISFAGHWD